MTKLEYTFKTDILFKMMFVKNPDLLKHLVCELLGIKIESIGKFVISNPDMPPENLGDKFCKLDILMDINGQRVNLEIQVRNKGNFPERVLFNWAREYSSALPSGKNYHNLPRVINISLIHFNLFKCKEFHSEFRPLEINRHELLSDKMSLHFFELKKIPVNINMENMLLLWLSLFRAETVEELKKIEVLEVPLMNQALSAYYSITADSEFRERERLWEKARHDEATALYHAEKKGIKRERKKWKSVVADKDAKWQTVVADKDIEIARLKAELEKRQ